MTVFYVKEPRPGETVRYPGAYIREATEPHGEYRVERAEASGTRLILRDREREVRVERGPTEFWTLVKHTTP
jgi:hypothetical protein